MFSGCKILSTGTTAEARKDVFTGDPCTAFLKLGFGLPV